MSPIPVVSPDLDLQLTADSTDAAVENVRRSVDEQIQRVLGEAASIQVDVRSGNPADIVCRAAEEINASLIVTGLGRRHLIDRLLADETTVKIIRCAPTPVSTIYLANVAPRPDLLSFPSAQRAAYEAHAMQKLRQLARDLQAPAGVHLQPIVKHGDPATALLEYASDTQSDLIAIGTRGLGSVSRLLLGSVATKIVRASSIAVLTVPA